jgi:hypothetical protein
LKLVVGTLLVLVGAVINFLSLAEAGDFAPVLYYTWRLAWTVLMVAATAGRIIVRGPPLFWVATILVAAALSIIAPDLGQVDVRAIASYSLGGVLGVLGGLLLAVAEGGRGLAPSSSGV